MLFKLKFALTMDYFGMGIGQSSFPLGDGRRFIAPFWGDVDTRGTGTVWFGETSDETLLIRARNEIRAELPCHSTSVWHR